MIDPDISKSIAIIILGGWAGYKEIMDRRSRKRERSLAEEYGLAGNPGRCRDHAEAINSIRQDIKQIKDHLEIV